MADEPKSFLGRHGGSATEQRKAVRVATTDGARNDAGAGQGQRGAPGTTPTTPPNTVLPQYTKSDNNFPHVTSNVVASGQKTDFGPIKLNEAFRPNVLDNYDVVTYHWKFFITTPDASSTGNVFNLNQQTIIAESGVTDITIDNVVIESIATPSVDSGTGISTQVRFTLMEPAGAGLIDKIFYESLALGIGNWNVMPFYLQLQFRGRNPETSEVSGAEPGTLESLRWLWSLKLSDMKANVTTVGTKYEVSAIVYNDLAQSNAYFSLQHAIVLEDLSDFGDAMAKLQSKLNQDQVYRLIDNASIPDVYIIKTDPEILKNCEITPSDHNTDSQRNDSTIQLNGKNASFAAATSIDKIIDSLLAQTKKYQKLIKNSDTAAANGKDMNQEVDQMKKFWRIITESRPLKFDPRQRNYAREFTIFIVEYDIGVLDTNTTQDSAGDKTIEAERKRLETYVKKSILRKKYNYIFTGLNDQVINFDIRINNAFASAQARMGGIYYNTAMADKGMVNQNHSNDEATVTEKLRGAISFLNTASPGELAADEGLTVQQTRFAIQNSELDDSAKQRFLTILATAKPADWTTFAQQLQNAGGIDQNGQLSAVRLRAQSIATPVTDKTSDQTLRFISNVNPGGPDAKKAYADYIAGIKGKIRPIARIDTMQQRQIGPGVESSSNSGIQKLSSIFAVAMHSNQDVSFAKVSLNIKGDPFWLFPQPTIDGRSRLFNSTKPDAEAFEWIKRAHFQAKDSVNVTGTDNFIIIRFRTPRTFDVNDTAIEDTNALKDVETFSGVFKVVTITSKFENGKFHQELHCLMDYNINILNFMDEIEGNAQIQDKPVNPETMVGQNPIPVTARATQRVFGQVNVPGVQSQFSIAGSPVVLGKGPALSSNIPTRIPSAPGLPDIVSN